MEGVDIFVPMESVPCVNLSHSQPPHPQSILSETLKRFCVPRTYLYACVLDKNKTTSPTTEMQPLGV